MKERVLSLDLIKIFAMIGVVSLHTTLGLESYDNIFSRYLYSLGGWAIPLFFATSGFLQIGRTIDFKYILKKSLRIFKIIVFVACIYWLKDGGDAVSLVKDYILLSLLQKGPVGHFWFLGAIILCYAATPFFNKVMKKPWGTELCLIILFLLMSFAFVANVKDNFESNIIQTFRLWNWLFYYCLGGYIRQNSEQIKAFFNTDYKWKTISRPILFILLGGALYTIFFSYLTPSIGKYGAEFMFGSSLCVFSVLAIFVTILQMPIKRSFMISEISPLFIPVYAFHDRVIGAVMKYGHFPFFGYFEPVAQWALVLLLILSVSWLIMKTPYLKNIFVI